MENLKNNKIKPLNYDYSKMNNMLGMFTTPYLGIYGNEYAFFTPIKIFHKQNPSGNLLETFPEKLKKNLISFRNRFNVVTDYFDIATDASFILNKFHKTNITHHLRVNCLLHPYLFYDVEALPPNREHKTICFCALFSDENLLELNSLYIEDTKEPDGLRINPDFIVCDENKKEVILHDSGEGFPALSPNNMAFLMDLKNGFFSFYLVAAATYGNKVLKLLITRFVVVMNTEVPIFKGFNKAFNSMHKSQYVYAKDNLNSRNNNNNNNNNNYNAVNKLSGVVDNINNNNILRHDNSNIGDINIHDNANNEKIFTIDSDNSESNSQQNSCNKNINDFNKIDNNQFRDINLIKSIKKKFISLSSEAIKYNLTNLETPESKIKLENFLSELFYFENLFKIITNFTRNFIITKTYEVINTLGTKNELIKSDAIENFVLDLIKISFESIYLDENFEILNKNSQCNFYDLNPEEENWGFIDEDINSIPNFSSNKNDNKINESKNFNHENKINDYYPYKNFESKFKHLHIGKSEKQDPNHKLIGEFGLFKFSKFLELLFNKPSIDKFGMKLFSDYVSFGKENKNYFFLKFIDNFFILELDKVITTSNKYRVFLNEFELNVPLSGLLEKSVINAPKAEYFEITNTEIEIFSKFHINLITLLKKNNQTEKVLDQIDLNANLALEKYCDRNPLYSLIERIKTSSRRKSNANLKNDTITIDPVEELHEIVYNINNLDLTHLDEKEIDKSFECPFKEVFSKLVDVSLNDTKDYEINQIVEKLSPNYQNYLFYKTWEKKGKVLGIHDDFGRHSFLGTKYIDPLYHIKSEDKVEMLFEIIAIIENIQS